MGGSSTPRTRTVWAFTVVLAVVAITVAAVAASVSPVRATGTTDLRVGSFEIDDEAIYGSPVLVEGLVVLPFADRYVAYDILTGSTRWESASCEWPDSAAPAGTRDGLRQVVRCGGELRMLDLGTGEFLWSQESDYAQTMLRATRDHVVIGLGTSVVVLDGETGDERFRWEPDTEQFEDITVAAGEDLVLIGTDNRLWAFDGTGEELWSAPVIPSSVWVLEDRIVVREPQRQFRSLDPETGKVLETETMKDVTTPYSMIIGGQDDTAVLALSGEESMLYAVDGTSTELIWKTDEGTWFRDYIDGTVAIDDLDGCAALRASDGEERFRCPEDAIALGVDARRAVVVTMSEDLSALTVEVVRLEG